MAREIGRSYLDKKMIAYLESKWPGISNHVSKFSITGGVRQHNELHLTMFLDFAELENVSEGEE